MAASAIRVDRPPERHGRRFGHSVERGLRVDLVEAGVERLGCVETADDRAVAVAREAGLFDVSLNFDSQVVPAHEHMFAHRDDGPGYPPARATSDISPASVCEVAPVIATGTVSPGSAIPPKLTTLLWRERPRTRLGSLRDGPSTRTSNVRPTKRWARARAPRWTVSTRRSMRATATSWPTTPSVISAASVPRRGE